MHLMKFFCMIAVLTSFALWSAELPSSVQFSKNGSFRIDGTDFFIQGFSSNWKGISNVGWDKINSKLDQDGLQLTATMPLEDSKANVTETVKPTNENSFQLDFQAKFLEPTTPKSIHCAFNIPAVAMTITVDGKSIALPAKYKKQILYQNNQAKTLTLTLPGGTELTITGNPLKLFIQDDRAFNKNYFAFRIGGESISEAITESSINLRFEIKPLSIQKIALSKTVNAGFADEIAGDGKGGWTDQGPEMDLHMIKSGTLEIGSLKFDILDPAKNAGKGVLVLTGKDREFTPSNAVLELPTNQGLAINLLHASAWTPNAGVALGTITAKYADGSEEKISVDSRADCGNWVDPITYKNATVAWSSETRTGTVGLYASSFALKKSGPSSIHFEINAPNAYWMIAGVTLSDRHVHTISNGNCKPVAMKENNQWKRLDYKRTLNKGNILDFSFNVDGPAGKYGRIVSTPAGTLTFENAPDKRVKLFGTNLVHSASFIKKEHAEEVADYLAYCGYNSVRFHHNDKQMNDPKAQDTVTINPEKLDLFDYTFYCMKKRGLYITTDFYASRVFKPGDNIPECNDFNASQIMKALIGVSPATMENWKQFARNWMNHKNPYTGMTWAEDPALFCVNLINEEVLSHNWRKTPNTMRLYEEAFKKFCLGNQLPLTKASNDNPVFRRFLQEVQAKVLDEQIRFVKEELGMKALVTSLNYINSIPLTLLRQKFDVVDDHQYLDHPGFPGKQWCMPHSHRQNSAITAMGQIPRSMMPSRIYGKAFIVTEFNYCLPNIYRAEAGPLIGAYAALQDWDALFRFGWSNSDSKNYTLGIAETFYNAGDPFAQFLDRIAMTMFIRGDVEPAKESYAYCVPKDCFEKKLLDKYPNEFTQLGLIAKIGSVAPESKNIPTETIRVSPENASNPAKLKNQKIATLWKQANETKVAVSSTGQLQLDANTGTFAVNTPRTASATLRTGDLVVGALKVEKASCLQTITAISMDEKPLGESNSVLVFQLTDLANTGDLYSDASKKLLLKFGKTPLLVQKGTASVSLASPRPYQVTALNCDGEPYGKVETTYENGYCKFTANTGLFPGGVMVYHLTR